jgi:hypothetical protein
MHCKTSFTLDTQQAWAVEYALSMFPYQRILDIVHPLIPFQYKGKLYTRTEPDASLIL